MSDPATACPDSGKSRPKPVNPQPVLLVLGLPSPVILKASWSLARPRPKPMLYSALANVMPSSPEFPPTPRPASSRDGAWDQGPLACPKRGSARGAASQPPTASPPADAACSAPKRVGETTQIVRESSNAPRSRPWPKPRRHPRPLLRPLPGPKPCRCHLRSTCSETKRGGGAQSGSKC